MSACKSCQAPIEWFTTTAGKAIPLDPGAVADGNLVVNAAGEVQAFGPLELLALPAGTIRRRSHYATCPDAASWRGRKDRK
jgi:hypothetical protein